MVELYKGEDVGACSIAIVTDNDNEELFCAEFTDLMQDVIKHNIFDDLWSYYLPNILTSYVEVCCKLRGYKSDVSMKTVITAGKFDPTKNILVGKEGPGEMHMVRCQEQLK